MSCTTYTVSHVATRYDNPSLVPLVGKLPAISGWRQLALSGPQLAAWWDRNGRTDSYGIVTGRASGLAVVDLDAAGWELLAVYAALEDRLGPIPETLAVATPSGGVHIYLEDQGGELRNRARLFGLPVDVRGEGGYVVGPGSVVDGAEYEDLTPGASLAALTPAILEALSSSRRPARAEAARQVHRPTHAADAVLRPSGGNLAAEAELFLAEATSAIEGTPIGRRNDALNWHAYYTGGFVAAGALERAAAEAAYTAAAGRAGLDEAEIPKTLASGLGDGIRDGALPRQCRGGVLPSRHLRAPERRKALAARWPAAELRPALALVHRAILAADWSHAGGATERRLLELLMGAAQDRGALDVEESSRRLAGSLRLSVGAVLEALRRLQRRGWLQLVQRGIRGRYGSVWRLQVPRAEPAEPSWRAARQLEAPDRAIKSLSISVLGLGCDSPRRECLWGPFWGRPATELEVLAMWDLFWGPTGPPWEPPPLVDPSDAAPWEVGDDLFGLPQKFLAPPASFSAPAEPPPCETAAREQPSRCVDAAP